MAGVNKVILLGNLGKDPDTKYTQNGGTVCTFSLATTETYKDNESGEKKQNTEWHRIVTFGRLAEVAAEYLRKGSQVYIEGSIRLRQWEDKDGNKRSVTQIHARSMQLLGKPPEGEKSEPGEIDDDVPF
jgi:single-strand DNA-binding protein